MAPHEIVVPVFHPFRHEARVNPPSLHHETVNAPLGPGIPFPYSTIAIQGHAESPERLCASFHPATSSLHREKPVCRAIMRLELEIPATIGRSFDELMPCEMEFWFIGSDYVEREDYGDREDWNRRGQLESRSGSGARSLRWWVEQLPRQMVVHLLRRESERSSPRNPAKVSFIFRSFDRDFA